MKQIQQILISFWLILSVFGFLITASPSYSYGQTASPTPDQTAEDLFKVGDIVKVSGETAFLLLYAEPDDTSDVLEALLSGTALVIVGGPQLQKDVHWWSVQSLSGINGWVSSKVDGVPTLVTSRAAPAILSTSPPPFTDAQVSTFAIGDFAGINGTEGVLLLHADASEESAILEVLLNGVLVTIRDNAVEVEGVVWWPIESPSGLQGWVPQEISGQQVLMPQESMSHDGDRTSDISQELQSGQDVILHLEGNVLLLHSEPDPDSGVLEALVSGIVVRIVDGPESINGTTWWRVRSPSQIEGWVPQEIEGATVLFPPDTVFATPTLVPSLTPLPSPTPAGLFVGGTATIHTTRGDTLNVRNGPGTNYQVLTELRNGSVVSIIGGPQQGGPYTWWKIRTASGIEGWAVESADRVQTLQSGVPSANTTPEAGQAYCNGVPSRFQIGETVVVSELGDALRLMTDYTLGARGALGQLSWGNQVRIDGNAVCDYSNLYNQEVWYWYVYSPRHGKYGWVQDGLAYERWLCPLSNPTCDR